MANHLPSKLSLQMAKTQRNMKLRDKLTGKCQNQNRFLSPLLKKKLWSKFLKDQKWRFKKVRLKLEQKLPNGRMLLHLSS